MSIGKIVVLRRSFASLSSAFAPAPQAAVGAGWSAFTGKNGATFGAQAIDDGTLVMPFVGFESDDELALHLREILGDALDEHGDTRGVFVLPAGSPPEDRRYDTLVSEEGSFLPVVAADDPRLQRQEGWLFSSAAQSLRESMPAAEQRAESRPADEDPFARAAEKFNDAFAARNERGNLRKSLSNALEHSLENSALGAFMAPAERPGMEALDKREETALVDPLERALGSNPAKATEMEALLRSTVEKDLKAGEADAASGEATSDVTSGERDAEDAQGTRA
ncbi:hypothetical protein [Chondromyces apiculatus]|uniref:Uncharacterized protein n=1 Tax=Chondromyces apiculatus DSM 436 TaxID=1192034 RepID=A0A017T7U9_9BACT|nr:hypothetical protein [Chondromyces apiculatus]EYF04885.1 Hypothetical protein CAP_3911 [Chondromyces apiculatus DSM 436]